MFGIGAYRMFCPNGRTGSAGELKVFFRFGRNFFPFGKILGLCLLEYLINLIQASMLMSPATMIMESMIIQLFR